MIELPPMITALYKLSNTVHRTEDTGETVSIFLEVNFETKTFRILDYKKRDAFVFHNGKYAYRWTTIAGLIQQASDTGRFLLATMNDATIINK